MWGVSRSVQENAPEVSPMGRSESRPLGHAHAANQTGMSFASGYRSIGNLSDFNLELIAEMFC